MGKEGVRHVEHIRPAAQGRLLLEHLARQYTHSSRETWARRLQCGEIEVPGHSVSPRLVLRTGMQLIWHRPGWKEPRVPLGFAVLYRDPEVLVVAKPSGLPTMPGGGRFHEHTLLHQLRRSCDRATPLHRLGRGTSGLVLCGRTDLARSKLTGDFRENRIRKVYRGLVTGHVERHEGSWTTPIGSVPHARLRSVHAAGKQGKPARTDYRVLQHRDDSTLMEFRLYTGRPHQIRIHAAAAGHPLAGDPLYPVGGIPVEDCEAVPSDLGYLLHAEELGFPHPRTDQPLVVHCTPPTALR